MRPDRDGDCMFAGNTQELMTGLTNVRVLITPETSQGDVLRALKKVRKWIKQDGLYLNDMFLAAVEKAKAENFTDEMPF